MCYEFIIFSNSSSSTFEHRGLHRLQLLGQGSSYLCVRPSVKQISQNLDKQSIGDIPVRDAEAAVSVAA